MKLLTHLHIVVYTWWCWHICKGRGVPRVERGLACEAGFNAFEKNKCIFYITPMGNLEKSRECFSLTGRSARRHRTLA